MASADTAVFLDFETRSAVDLKRSGAPVYAEDPSTEVLMLSWCVVRQGLDAARLRGRVRQWVPKEGEPFPRDLRALLEDDSVILEAHNAAFERLIFQHVLGMAIPVHRWRDTMVRCLAAGLPGDLGKAARALGLPEEFWKDQTGSRIGRKFWAPRKRRGQQAAFLEPEDAPEDWEAFKRYNRQDVVAEMAVHGALAATEMPDWVWEEWWLDQRINDAGIPVRRAMVENAVRLYEEHRGRLLEELARRTGLANPNSRDQMLGWLQERGYALGDLRAESVSTALSKLGLSSEVREVLEIWQQVSLRSGTKYQAVLDALSGDDHLRHVFQFWGASRTGRWAGRRFQPQNLPRPPYWMCPEPAHTVGHAMYWTMARAIERMDLDTLALVDDPAEILRGGVRAVAQAPAGMSFVDCDLSAIENVIVGWVAGENKILDVFRQGRDPYIDFARYMYGGTYEEIHHEVKVLGKKEKRKVSKPAVLGCGYMLGAGRVEEDAETGLQKATGLLAYAWSMGVDMTPEQAERAVKTYREQFSRVVQFWYRMHDAVCATVQDGRPRRYRSIHVFRRGSWLVLRLPSGRCLHYLRPKVDVEVTPWGAERMQFSYQGRRKNGSWGRVTAHPGLLTENIVQAIARDVLAVGLRRAAARGLDIRMHVHDQIVCLVRDEEAEAAKGVLEEAMTAPIAWLPDAPLAASAFVSKVFMKD